MTMKTPEQVAHEMFPAHTAGQNTMRIVAVNAIRADRAQRDVSIIEQIAETLDARGVPSAAKYVRDNEQEIYDQHIGPMIDQLEEDSY